MVMTRVVLETKNLSKYYGDLKAVDRLDLEVFEGEVFGFLGPNGAGKTTAINMMVGLLKPDCGEVMVLGQTMDKADPGLRTRIGVCPQETVLWERLTCYEQLQFIGRMYGLTAPVARERSERLLLDLGLEGKGSRLARTLSGGMRRRLNLAMALVHDPDIVVLDEPEAGLDPQSRVRVREYIRSLARAKTVILTTHNMDEADRVADRVAIIDHGKLLVLDTPEGLKARVGAGDVIEIQIENQPLPDEETITERLSMRIGAQCLGIEGRLLRLRSQNALRVLPAILENLDSVGLQAGEVRIRENTLEDVFIQLTGKRLRS
jgi:ABC-2 type transport system ATP-binding protein